MLAKTSIQIVATVVKEKEGSLRPEEDGKGTKCESGLFIPGMVTFHRPE